MKRIFCRLRQFTLLVIPLILIFLTVALSGCDFSAHWDLKRAEKALKEADQANAEFWAEPEYRKAQKYLIIAMDEARDRNINEARDAALEAREWAEEATELSIRRREEMEEEHDAVNRKKF